MSYGHEQLEHKEKRPRVGAMMPKVQKDLWEQMRTYLEARGLHYNTAVENGWYPSDNAGDNEDRIVMPATNSHGLAYWQARAIGPKVEKRYQSASVPRGDSVIQLWPLQKEYLPVLVISEGPMDALAAASAGVRAVALMGISPTEETMDMLVTLSMDVEFLTFFADRDAIPEAIVFLQRCLKRGLNMTISSPDPYKDLAAIPKKRREQIIELYLAHCKKYG